MMGSGQGATDEAARAAPGSGRAEWGVSGHVRGWVSAASTRAAMPGLGHRWPAGEGGIQPWSGVSTEAVRSKCVWAANVGMRGRPGAIARVNCPIFVSH
jgi:hypothetical protein